MSETRLDELNAGLIAIASGLVSISLAAVEAGAALAAMNQPLREALRKIERAALCDMTPWQRARYRRMVRVHHVPMLTAIERAGKAHR